MILILAACAAAAAYQVLAAIACLKQLRTSHSAPLEHPGVSILKPVRGVDENFYQAIRSHALISWPEYELLFGIRDADDPAWNYIKRLQTEFPDIRIRAIQSRTDAPNPKVGVLRDLASEARHPVLVVNDSDITVPPDYLQQLVAGLEEPGVGLVTCLYRATASSVAATLEAVGVATDFAPGVLVARLLGMKAFGLGSTLAFRAETLQAIGGFSAIRDYLADDYHLGKRIAEMGLKVLISPMPVSTQLSGGWNAVWAHQLRWARTIRITQGGYFGLPVTYAGVWALVALMAGAPLAGVSLLAIRIVSGLISGALVLRDPLTARYWWTIPVRDVLAVGVWLAASLGRTVQWRGRKLKIDSEGRITAAF